MPVTLVERYNPAWPEWFAQIVACLQPALQDLPHEIHHMGSTSVRGMTAKPIIDLTIAIAPGSFALVRERLGSAGWNHVGDQGIPGREVFKPIDGQRAAALPVHHLYACGRDACELRKMLAYRDYMRAHPEWSERLSTWKWRLAEALQNDRQSYIDGKDAMMREIMRYAWIEAGVTPQPGEEARPDEIAAFLEGYPSPAPEMAVSVRGMVRRVLPDIQESLDAASRIIAYGYGPGYKDTICTLILSKTGVKLGIFRGASLADPEGAALRHGQGTPRARVRASVRSGSEPARQGGAAGAGAGRLERPSVMISGGAYTVYVISSPRSPAGCKGR